MQERQREQRADQEAKQGRQQPLLTLMVGIFSDMSFALSAMAMATLRAIDL